MTQPAREEPTAPEPEVSSCEQELPHLAPVPDTPSQPAEQDTATAGSASSESVPEPEQEAEEPEPQEWRDRARDVAEQVREFVTAPDVWSQDRPSLSKVWRYARYSEQLPPSGPTRVAAVAYSGVAVSVHAVAYTAAWLVERPARAVMVAVLVTLAAVFSPTRMLLTVLLTPAYLLIELITNY